MTVLIQFCELVVDETLRGAFLADDCGPNFTQFERYPKLYQLVGN